MNTNAEPNGPHTTEITHGLTKIQACAVITARKTSSHKLCHSSSQRREPTKKMIAEATAIIRLTAVASATTCTHTHAHR